MDTIMTKKEEPQAVPTELLTKEFLSQFNRGRCEPIPKRPSCPSIGIYDNAIYCIDRHLDADRPIIIGVNHSSNRQINEGATDHWVVIVGREYDETLQQYYYTYMDTGRNNAEVGCNTTENRLYYDSANRTFRDSAASIRDQQVYNVTQIRPNDGQNLNETIVQPVRP